jgi:hypothetical protein
MIGVCILVLALRGNSIVTPFERDEGEYAYSARLLLRGGVPYTESFLQKPPPIVYTYALGQLFDPYGVSSPRLLAILFVLGTIYLVGYIAHKEFGWIAGVAGMWVVTPMLSFPYLAALAANTEIFMLLPLTGTVALFVKSKTENSSSYKLHIFAGFLGTTAILYKPIAIFPLVFLFIVWLVRIRSKTQTMHTLVRAILLWSMGCVISLIVFLGYFILRGAGPALWESTVEFNRHYATFFGLGFEYVAQRMSTFLLKWTPLFFFMVWALAMQLRKSWFYFGLLLSSLLGVFQTPIGHYYLLLMPFWAILCAGAIYHLSRFIEAKSTLLFSLLITFIVAIYMLMGVGEQFSKTPLEIGRWVYGQGNPFEESVMIAKKLQEFTSPSDTIFIAGSEPQILYYADRKSSSRFVITYPFVIKTPMQVAYQKETIRELKENHPEAIVLSQRAESGLWDEKSPQDFRIFLTELLNTKYNLVGATVWESDEVVWKSSPAERDITYASLLLFKRK